MKRGVVLGDLHLSQDLFLCRRARIRVVFLVWNKFGSTLIHIRVSHSVTLFYTKSSYSFGEDTGQVHQEHTGDNEQPCPSLAFLHLINPSTSPVYIFNIASQIARTHQIIVPEEIKVSRMIGDGPFFPLTNVTPRHTIVNTHIDHGHDGLLHLVFGQKILLAWPSPARTLLGEQQPLHLKCQELEAGIVCYLHKHSLSVAAF
jgi:hypothetical protein